MGFWHTGYIEFHEPQGLDFVYVPVRPVYSCQHCGGTFETTDALQKHRFERHPYIRPGLFIRGVEAGNVPIRITESLRLSDLGLFHYSSLKLNGMPISLTELGKHLIRTTNDTAVLELTNEAVSACFTLQFDIASEPDLIGVDRCFFNVAKRGRLDVRALEDFISDAQAFPSAIRYCDGVCEYFYGVLVKEGASGSSLPYEQYRDKFSRAADILEDFHRPLARMIGALIAFHFNHFHEAMALAGNSRVGIAAARYNQWLQGDLDGARRVLARERDDKLEKLLTDAETERLVAWCVVGPEVLRRQWADLDSLVAHDLPETDRAKLHILLAEDAAERGHVSDARRHARELRNNPALGEWAERLLERLSEKER
jgi:hypothetical protein